MIIFLLKDKNNEINFYKNLNIKNNIDVRVSCIILLLWGNF